MRGRDEYGRFTGDEDERGRRGSRSGGYGGWEDDDRRYRSSGGWREDDERERSMGRGEYGDDPRSSRSGDDDERYGRSSRTRSQWEDDDRGASRRGFGSMDPEQRREMGRMGGESGWSSRGRDWDRDWDDNDRPWRRGSARSNVEDDEDERGRRGGSSRGTRAERGSGFASMDPEERREIGRMGGEARWRGGNRDDDDDDDDRGRRGGSSRGTRAERGSGFASMDPEERREIARMGGEARWRGSNRDDDDDEDDRRGRRGGSSRGTRAERGSGFAAMDPAEHRRISRMGGQASQGGR